MKRVFIFVGLKLVEFLGVVIILFIGQQVPLYLWPEITAANGFWERWLVDGFFGFLMIAIAIFLPVFICWLAWRLLKKNWELSKKLSEK